MIFSGKKGQREVSDKRILARMMVWVHENREPTNFMIVSGDGGFADAFLGNETNGTQHPLSTADSNKFFI